MIECPICGNKNLLYYPKGYKKSDKKEIFECGKCDTQFNQTLEGKITIFKRGKSVLVE